MKTKQQEQNNAQLSPLKAKALPRKHFRRYTLTVKKEIEGEIKNIIKKFKFLKAARISGNKANREGAFISLYNHNGISLCL